MCLYLYWIGALARRFPVEISSASGASALCVRHFRACIPRDRRAMALTRCRAHHACLGTLPPEARNFQGRRAAAELRSRALALRSLAPSTGLAGPALLRHSSALFAGGSRPATHAISRPQLLVVLLCVYSERLGTPGPRASPPQLEWLPSGLYIFRSQHGRTRGTDCWD